MRLYYDSNTQDFYLHTFKDERGTAARIGFKNKNGKYRTSNYSIANRAKNYASACAYSVLKDWKPFENESPYIPVKSAPTGETYMTHQIEAIQFCLRYKRSLLAYSMGLGKTFAGLGWLDSLISVGFINSLIVVPACLIPDWQVNSLRWLGVEPVKLTSKTKLQGDTTYICSYAMLDRLKGKILENGIHNIIFDEAHYIKNADSKRGRAARVIIEAAERVLMMTGTPFMNSLQQSFNLFNLIDEQHFDSYYYHEDNLKKHAHKYMLHKRLEDVVDMPEKITQYLYINSNTNISNETYHELNSVWLDDGVTETIEFKDFSRARRKAAVEKIPIMKKQIDLLLSKLEPDEPLLLFCYHIAVVDSIYQYLKDKGESVVRYHSELSQQERKHAKESFITGETRIKVASQRSAGVGLNYQHCNQVMFLELDYVHANLEQCIHRVYRVGSTKTTIIRFLVVKNSHDEHVLKTVLRKQQEINKLIKQTTL